MLTIPLLAIPKQNLSISLNGTLYDLDVLSTAGVMSMNITRAGDLVAVGQRCVAGQLILNYFTQEAQQGNFMFLTQDDELPSYVEFNITQFLLFASEAELALVRANPQIMISVLQMAMAAQAAATMNAAGAHH